MNTDELKKACLDIMKVSEAVYLTSMGTDGYPFTRAILNLRNTQDYPRLVPFFNDHQLDFMVLISTNTSSNKIEQIKNNPRVNLYYCDPPTFRGLMLLGDIEMVDDTRLRHLVWEEGSEKYYPKGADDPDHSILRLFPKSARGWYEQEKYELELNS